MHGCQYILHDGLVVTVNDAEGPKPTLVEARINTLYIVNSVSPDIRKLFVSPAFTVTEICLIVELYVIVYDVITPYGSSGSDHVRETVVELTTAPLKSLGGSPGTKDQRKISSCFMVTK